VATELVGVSGGRNVERRSLLTENVLGGSPHLASLTSPSGGMILSCIANGVKHWPVLCSDGVVHGKESLRRVEAEIVLSLTTELRFLPPIQILATGTIEISAPFTAVLQSFWKSAAVILQICAPLANVRDSGGERTVNGPIGECLRIDFFFLKASWVAFRAGLISSRAVYSDLEPEAMNLICQAIDSVRKSRRIGQDSHSLAIPMVGNRPAVVNVDIFISRVL
jgi:hypothetical protein